MPRIILSTPLLKTFGCYGYDPASLEEAIAWLNQGPYFCALRSRDMYRVLREVTGRSFYPLVGMETPPLSSGDEALVFFVPITDTMPSVKGMPPEYMAEHYELGFLKRVDGVVQQKGPATETTAVPQEASLTEG